MRLFAPMLALACGAACASRRMPEASALQASRQVAERCDSGSPGVEVFTQVGFCPDRAEIDAEMAGFLGRMGADANALDGVKLVFVPYWMECAGIMSLGCSFERTILVYLSRNETGELVWRPGTDFREEPLGEPAEKPVTRRYDWRRTLAHELGHVLRDDAGLPGDTLHADRRWWNVAEDRSRKEPAFTPRDPHALAIRAASARRHEVRVAPIASGPEASLAP